MRPRMAPAYEFLYATTALSGMPSRYKVCKGGRGKGASWHIARRLIDKAHTTKCRILCTREVQNSIADSVHHLLKTQIEALGYSRYFYITDNRIRSRITGSDFIFKGLNDLTADSIRSMEGITDVWCAEAETMGARSWMILDPTIRAGGSEIYVDYNPDNINSATNKMFTDNCPDNATVRHLTFEDNPWFPEELEIQRQQALTRIMNARNEDEREQLQLDYNHVWLGHTRKVSKASILGASFVVENFDPLADIGTWDGPYDGADWGFSQDPTVRVRAWVHTMPTGRKRLCIEREAYGVGVELNDLPAMFDVFPNSRTTKIRADCARPETISHMKNGGFNIVGAEKWKGCVEDGIAHIKGAYDIVVVHTRCVRTAEEMLKYSFKVDRLTGEVLTDIIDAWNHCIDAIRYALDPLITRKKGGYFFAQ